MHSFCHTRLGTQQVEMNPTVSLPSWCLEIFDTEAGEQKNDKGERVKGGEGGGTEEKRSKMLEIYIVWAGVPNLKDLMPDNPRWG